MKYAHILYKVFFLTGLFLLFFFSPIQASEEAGGVGYDLDEFDFTAIQEVLEETFGKEKVDFQSFLEGLLRGEIRFSAATVWEFIKAACFQDMSANRKAMMLLLGVGIMAAVFHNVSIAFLNQQIAETAFFISYLSFMTISVAAFQSSAVIAADAMQSFEEFMMALIPSFFLAVTFASGSVTAVGFYQVSLVIVGLVNSILVNIVIPVIKVSSVFIIINHLSSEDLLSRLADLFRTAVQWTLKTLLAVVIGLNTMQGLMLPAIDHMKLSVLQKTIALIPGIGSSAEAAARLLGNSGMLIKNGVGAAAFFFIAVMAVIPIIKIAVFVLMLQMTTAMLQPVSDKRIVESLGGICECSKLLLQVIMTAGILYIVTIAIVCITTNLR